MAVGIQQVFYGYRRDVFTLAGLEQLLGAPRYLQQPVGRILAAISGFEEAILGIAFSRQFRIIKEDLGRRARLHERPVASDRQLEDR